MLGSKKTVFLRNLTRKNLVLNKKRSVVTIIGILLSSALIVCVSSMVTSVYRTMYTIAVGQYGNYHVEINQPEHFEMAAAMPDAYNLHRVGMIGYSPIVGAENRNRKYIGITTVDNIGASGLKVFEGREPKNADEILVSEYFERELDKRYQIGEKIELELGRLKKEARGEGEYGEMQMQHTFEAGEKKTYTIVGKIKRATFLMEGFTNPVYAFITLPDEKHKPKKESLLYLIKKPGEIDQHYRVLKEKAPKISPQRNYMLVNVMGSKTSEGKGAILIAAAIVVGIIMATSVFVIRNSFSISITEKTKQYGILKSLGATDRQIRRNVIYEGMTLGVVGTGLGILLGVAAAAILVWIVNYLLIDSIEGLIQPDTRLVFGLSWEGIAIATALSLMTVYLASIFIARRAKKLSPIEAIRSQKDVNIKKKDVRTLKLVNKVLSVSGLIAYKNLKRSRKKYRTTIASLTISVATFIAIFGFVEIISSSVRMQFKYINNNIQVTKHHYGLAQDGKLGETNKAIRDEAEELVKAALNDEPRTIISTGRIKIDDSVFTDEFFSSVIEKSRLAYATHAAYSVIDNESFKKALKENNLPGDTKLLAVNKVTEKTKNLTKQIKVYKKNHIKYQVKENSWGEQGRTIKNPVTKEADLAFIEKPPIGFYEMATIGGLVVIAPESECDKDIRFYQTSIAVNAKKDIEVAKKIDETLKANKHTGWQVQNISQVLKLTNNAILLVQIFGYGFILVITLIGLTNVFNAINTNVMLRQSDFASLKSIGMTRKEFRHMIQLESLMYGLKSLVIGLPLGVGLSMWIHKEITKQYEMPYEMPWVAIIISVIALMTIVRMIMGYSVKKIEEKNIIEVIRNENI